MIVILASVYSVNRGIECMKCGYIYLRIFKGIRQNSGSVRASRD
jgi:hypothetical protein